jgi:hypothetical protein
MTKAVDLAKTGSLVNSSGQIDLTTGVTGVLPVANGGTGSSSGVSPGGSTTQVQYNNAGAFGGDSGFVYSGGNVGIGATSPSYRLHVSDSSGTNTSGTVRLGLGTSYYGELKFNQPSDQVQLTAAGTSQTLGFFTGATPSERMRIDSSGNVGIGTNSPGSYGPSGSRLALVNTTSGEVCNLSVVNNSTDLYEGGGILLGNSGLTTGYDATYLYHHKFSSSGNDYSAFNISQRKVDGTYIANIWNVDYKNNALAWYRPNTGAQTMGIDASGNLSFNSGYGSVATAYGCRAWVKFTGTGTPGVSASGNVSSITDNGTGYYGVNFSTSMPDANYSVVGCIKPTTSQTGNNARALSVHWNSGQAAGYVNVVTATSSAGYEDPEFAYVAVFR